MGSFPERVELLWNTAPKPAHEYYAISIFLDANGRPEYSCFTGWLRYDNEKPPREVREASLVQAERVLKTWRGLHEPGMVVNDTADMVLFFIVGGNAVVEQSVAQQCVPQWLTPRVVVNKGEWGFTSPSSLPNTALQRAPSPKLRMQILKRDQYRCRVCGRSPSNHVDLELHVHHIRPWALGGMTEATNLITLCHTCHNGLEPHFDQRLFALLSPEVNSDRAAAYREKMIAYQRVSALTP